MAWENSCHFTLPPLVPLRNDIWEIRTEIPYWWHVTTQIWVVLLIGWNKFPRWHDQSEALPRSESGSEKWEVFTFSVTATMFSSAKCKWINQIQGLFKTTTKIQDLFKNVWTMMVTYSFLSQAFFVLLLPALGHPRCSGIIIITICCTQTFYFTIQEKIQATG